MKNHMIPILKTGTYTDQTGKTYPITKDILQEIVDSYQPNSAPLVKGHPKDNDPALGWIENLKVISNKLYASFVDITKEFQQEIKNHYFKNISASFFLPDSPSNPQKGKHCLRHVGALGATRPAIPDLGQLQDALSFAEEQDEISFFSAYPFSFHTILLAEIQKLHSFSRNNLLNQIQNYKQEIQQLKKELLSLKQKQDLNEKIEQLIQEKNLDTDTSKQLKDNILDLVKEGNDPKDYLANFAENIPNNKQTVYAHRFYGYYPNTESKGIASFSESTSVEDSAVFADEVEKLYSQGIARNNAYKQAKEILKRGGFHVNY